MIRYPYLVGELAANKPDASSAYELTGTALQGLRSIAAALSAGDVDDDDQLWIRAYRYDANGRPDGAQEVVLATFDDASPDTLARGALKYSTTGSKIDWSATGEDFVPAIQVVGADVSSPRITQYADLSAASEYDIKMLPGCNYRIELEGIDVSNDGVDIGIRVSTDRSTFDSGAGNYSWSTGFVAAATPGGTGNASATEMRMFNALFGNADDKEEISGEFWIKGAGKSGVYTRVSGLLRTASNANTEFGVWFSGSRLAAQADLAARLFPTAGTMSGRIVVWEYPQP